MIDALRQVIAKFSADLTPMEKDLAKGEKKVGAFEKSIKKIGATIAGAFAVKAVYDFTFGLIHMADETAKTADALGMGIVELQEWRHAADLSGIQNEMLTMSVNKLTLGLFEAATKGAGPAAEALKALGLEAEGTDGKIKTAGEVIEELADKYVALEDKAELTPHLMKLFGEQGAKLVPLLKGGSAGIRAMRDEVEELGFAFDEEFARGAEAFDDNLDRLNKGVRGFVIQALGPLLPDLIDMTGSLVRGAKAVIPMVKEFVQFIRQTKLLQAALALLTGKGLIVGTKALLAWVKGMGGLRGILMRVLPLIWKFIAPMLILEDLFTFLSGGKSALGDVLNKVFGEGTADAVRESIQQVGEFLLLFKTAPNIVRQAFGDMADDMRKSLGGWGDFAGGMVQNLADYFLFLTDVMTGGWDNAMAKMTAADEGLKLALKIAWTEIKFSALAVAAAISDAFVGAWNAIITGAQDVQNTVAGILDNIPLLGGVADSLREQAKSRDSLKGNDQRGQEVSRQWDNARLVIASDYDSIAGRLTASTSAGSQSVNQTVSNSTHINVNVPPGTPAQQARSVGREAARGAAQGTKLNLRSTKEALVPSPA